MNYSIHKVGGILLKDKKIVLCRSKGKEHFIAPGGKIEAGEEPKSALIRELKEELNVEVREASLKEFGTFYAAAAGDEQNTLRMDVFLVTDWMGEPMASSEIDEITWIDSANLTDIQVGSIFAHEVIPRLKASALIG